MRPTLIRFLTYTVIASVVMPSVIGVLLGLGALLASLGDDNVALMCRYGALLTGVVWLLSVIATAITAGVVAIEATNRTEKIDHMKNTDQRVDFRRE